MGRDLIYLWENLLWLHTEMTNIQDNSTMYFTARLEFFVFFFVDGNLLPTSPWYTSLIQVFPFFWHYIYCGGTSQPHKSGTVDKTRWRHLTAAGHISPLKSRTKTLKGKGKLPGTSGQFAEWQGSPPQLDTTLQPTRESKLGGAWICSPGRSRALGRVQSPSHPTDNLHWTFLQWPIFRWTCGECRKVLVLD